MMRSFNVRRVLTWVMVITLSQVFVFADRPETTNKSNAAAVGTATSLEAPLGRLVADGPVTINGVKAKTGDTVFTGAQIQTVAGIGASIQIGALGQLDISPDSNLVLNYDRGSINSTLRSGCAVLATSDGVQGLLTMPNGISKKIEALKGASVGACSDNSVNAGDISGATAVRMGAGSLSLGAGSVGFAEFGSMMLSSTAMVTGLNSVGYQQPAAAAGAQWGCCCCCCCCNPSPSAPCPKI